MSRKIITDTMDKQALIFSFFSFVLFFASATSASGNYKAINVYIYILIRALYIFLK